MKEDNYVREIQKLEAEKQSDLARKEDKYESILAAKEARFNQRFEELDDKYTQALSEIDHVKSILENKEILVIQLESDINNFSRKENKIREQYEKQISDQQTSYRNLELDIARVQSDKDKLEITIDKMANESRNTQRKYDSTIEELKHDLEATKDEMTILAKLCRDLELNN